MKLSLGKVYFIWYFKFFVVYFYVEVIVLANTVPREELLDCVLDIMENNKRSHGSCYSVPCISFVKSEGSTSLQNNRVIYSIGMQQLEDNVDVDTATNLVVQSKHEGRHSEQIIDLFNDGKHDLMLIDWLSDQTGIIFYNFNEHEDLHEWDAYHEGLVQARPILTSWFGKDVADEALLKLYMGLVENKDTLYFTYEKCSDYTNLDEYISDMERFGESLYHTRTRIDVNAMYGLNSRVMNTGDLVKDYPEDWYQEELRLFGKKDKSLLRHFLRTRNAFDQRKIVAGFMSLDKSYEYLIPGIQDIDWTVQVRRGPFGFCGVDAANFEGSLSCDFAERINSSDGMYEMYDTMIQSGVVFGFERGMIDVVLPNKQVVGKDIGEIKTSSFWNEVRSINEELSL